MMNRPVGVTILGILAIVGGVIAIIAAIASVLGAFALAALGASALAVGSRGAALGAAGFVILMILGVWILILGVLDIIFGVGALRLRPWAWTLGVVLMAISVITDVLRVFAGHTGFAGMIVGLAISLFILYYLFTPEVKAAFGKTGVGPDMPSLTGQSAAPAGTYGGPPPSQPYGAPPAQQPPAQQPPAQQPPAQPYGAPPAQQPPAQQPPTPPA